MINGFQIDFQIGSSHWYNAKQEAQNEAERSECTHALLFVASIQSKTALQILPDGLLLYKGT